MTAQYAIEKMQEWEAAKGSPDREAFLVCAQIAAAYATMARTLLLVEHNELMRVSIAVAEEDRKNFLDRFGGGETPEYVGETPANH